MDPVRPEQPVTLVIVDGSAWCVVRLAVNLRDPTCLGGRSGSPVRARLAPCLFTLPRQSGKNSTPARSSAFASSTSLCDAHRKPCLVTRRLYRDPLVALALLLERFEQLVAPARQGDHALSLHRQLSQPVGSATALSAVSIAVFAGEAATWPHLPSSAS